jgi:hypothetical protein
VYGTEGRYGHHRNNSFNNGLIIGDVESVTLVRHREVFKYDGSQIIQNFKDPSQLWYYTIYSKSSFTMAAVEQRLTAATATLPGGMSFRDAKSFPCRSYAGEFFCGTIDASAMLACTAYREFTECVKCLFATGMMP